MSDDNDLVLDAESNSNADNVLIVSDSAVSLADKERERRQIQADIEAFLASGGEINAVESNTVADPPKKPDSSYGSQPI